MKVIDSGKGVQVIHAQMSVITQIMVMIHVMDMTLHRMQMIHAQMSVRGHLCHAVSMDFFAALGCWRAVRQSSASASAENKASAHVRHIEGGGPVTLPKLVPITANRSE